LPLISISTNKNIKNQHIFLKKSSNFISSLLDKSEDFVMVKLNDSLQIYFAGKDSPCCFIEIKSIGSIEPSKMSKPICEFFSNELKIPSERIYVNFQDINKHMWAWNGRTFG
tara:strand:- start:764 stop:1099 length:336 start_codon:yes stop_codon:yes gene_type:complete